MHYAQIKLILKIVGIDTHTETSLFGQLSK